MLSGCTKPLEPPVSLTEPVEEAADDDQSSMVSSSLIVPTPSAQAVTLAMSEVDARRRTLEQLDPRSEPTIEVSVLATAREVEAAVDSVGSGSVGGTLEDGTYWYVVEANMAPPQLLGATEVGDAEWALRYVAIYNAETAEQHHAFGYPGLQPNGSVASAGDIVGAGVKPTIVPRPASTPIGLRGWPWPWGGSEDVRDAPPRPEPLQVDGEALESADMSPMLRAVLGAYTLLPGNRWTYREDIYEHSRWKGVTYTDTVGSMLSLGPELTLITSSRELRTSGTEAKSHTYPTYHLIWRDELYASDDPSRVVVWIDYFRSVPDVPTAAPQYEYMLEQENGRDGRPAPGLRLPIRVRDKIPIAGLGANWNFQAPEAMNTEAGAFETCFEAHHGGNESGWMWFCDGVGLVREESVKGGTMNVISIAALESVNIGTTAKESLDP